MDELSHVKIYQPKKEILSHGFVKRKRVTKETKCNEKKNLRRNNSQVTTKTGQTERKCVYRTYPLMKRIFMAESAQLL